MEIPQKKTRRFMNDQIVTLKVSLIG